MWEFWEIRLTSAVPLDQRQRCSDLRDADEDEHETAHTNDAVRVTVLPPLMVTGLTDESHSHDAGCALHTGMHRAEEVHPLEGVSVCCAACVGPREAERYCRQSVSADFGLGIRVARSQESERLGLLGGNILRPTKAGDVLQRTEGIL